MPYGRVIVNNSSVLIAVSNQGYQDTEWCRRKKKSWGKIETRKHNRVGKELRKQAELTWNKLFFRDNSAWKNLSSWREKETIDSKAKEHGSKIWLNICILIEMNGSKMKNVRKKRKLSSSNFQLSSDTGTHRNGTITVIFFPRHTKIAANLDRF